MISCISSKVNYKASQVQWAHCCLPWGGHSWDQHTSLLRCPSHWILWWTRSTCTQTQLPPVWELFPAQYISLSLLALDYTQTYPCILHNFIFIMGTTFCKFCQPNLLTIPWGNTESYYTDYTILSFDLNISSPIIQILQFVHDMICISIIVMGGQVVNSAS